MVDDSELHKEIGEAVQSALDVARAAEADSRCSRWQLYNASVFPGLEVVRVYTSWMRIDHFPFEMPSRTSPEDAVELLLEQDRRFPYNSWKARQEHFWRATQHLRDELYIRASLLW